MGLDRNWEPGHFPEEGALSSRGHQQGPLKDKSHPYLPATFPNQSLEAL